MPLSRLAREFAAEIHNHDWSDAPFRADRAGHQREYDTGHAHLGQLDQTGTDCVRMNVMWVVGQVLGHADPNFDPYEFAEWCGVDTATPSGRPKSGVITAGLRVDHATGLLDEPGGPETADEETYDAAPGERVGTDEQRARPWPTNLETRGFITKRGRTIHSSEQCPKYRYGIESAKRHGRKIHPAVWTTTGAAKAAGKGICSYCWTS
ncbi:MAG: hypothetical protein M3406_10015 [Chloroflexota bacterium]|nr:hypothetical protein [Chloroflexota bacterium]